MSFFYFLFHLHTLLIVFVFTADDPKSGQYSEDEGWQFITLGDQVAHSLKANLHVLIYQSI